MSRQGVLQPGHTRTLDISDEDVLASPMRCGTLVTEAQ